MRVERYVPHLRPCMEHLTSTHNIPDLGIGLPKLGIVVFKDNTDDMSVPVCAGFLREVEGGAYMFDSLISNKKLNSEQRHQGMTQLWAALLELAGNSYVFAMTVDEGTKQRGETLGFVALPHTTYEYKRK